MYILRICFIILIAVLCGTVLVQAQITEKFGDEVDGNTTFSQGGYTFTITGGYLEVEQKTGWGYDDNFYIENSDNQMTSATVVGSFLSTSSDFKVQSLYLITLNSSKLIEQTNDILIRGKLNGSTVFTHTVYYDQINMTSTNNYFTFVDLSSYSSYIIDELEFEVDPYQAYYVAYLMIDDFRFTPVSTVDFTNGSAFTPSITKGSSFQPIGRFELTGDLSGASLTAASIKLNGARTGLTNFKLWASTDATFNAGSDSQIGSTVTEDPGDGNMVTFNSFTSSIGTGGTYYFLTADVDAGATGVVQGVIASNDDLTISNGTLSGTITNAPLSNGDASLPVQLSSFSARIQDKTIVLDWQTESETNNLGFTLERSTDNVQWVRIASYQTHQELIGHGNASTTTAYTYTDLNVTPGEKYYYRIADVNTAGKVTMHSPISVTMTALPQTTDMARAYPNPFNPETMIRYQLHRDSRVTITVYDMLGRQVKTLVDAEHTAGEYHVTWNGKSDNGSMVGTGMYLVRMETENRMVCRKVLYLK